MRKGTLVSILAAALVPAAAHADVTLYGKIYAEFGNETFGSGATEVEYTTLDDAQNLGRLGVRFSESIGGDLEVFGQYEFSLNAPDSTSDFQMRASHVGIRGKSMSFAMGRFDGAYKITGGTAWDPFAFTSLQLAGTGGQSNTNIGNAGFIDRAFQFQANYGQDGVSFQTTLQYAADDSPASVTTPSRSFLGGLSLGIGGSEVIYAFARNSLNSTTNQKFGVKLPAGDATFIAQIEDVEAGGYDLGGEGEFRTGIVTYAMGNWLWVLEIAEYNSDYVPVLPATSADTALFTIGGRYYLSKNAWVVFGNRDTDSKDDTRDSTATVVGLRYDF